MTCLWCKVLVKSHFADDDQEGVHDALVGEIHFAHVVPAAALCLAFSPSACNRRLHL